jgi:hypothetical protein
MAIVNEHENVNVVTHFKHFIVTTIRLTVEAQRATAI